ncbi:hypothetical protein GGF32_009396 [Allomyces javanicus]|nr:hypothetical protein GGF32_009396 [Allomyces javanicus]
MAFALASDGRKVLLLERDLSEPDRIVGELMQPGGMLALESLGLTDALDGADAVDVQGYVILDKDETCHLSYPHIPTGMLREGDAARGRSFHHGRFIMGLRRKCREHPNIMVVEATVTSLVRDVAKRGRGEPRVVGVTAMQRTKPGATGATSGGTESHLEFRAPLTIVADGCFSKFRKPILGTAMQAPSHFVGLILEDITLPMPNHGHVVLADPSPILLYQIASRDTRILVDVPGSKYPSNAHGELTAYLRSHVAPQLPTKGNVRSAFLHALDAQRVRVMPNPYLPPSTQGHVPGLILLGDAHNMRHPLTGGGMSVGLNDVVILRRLLNRTAFPSFDGHDAQLRRVLRKWAWERKRLGAVVNILANALYALFSAGDDPHMRTLRRACFEYLRLGGECTNAPVRLLACLAPSPTLLVGHFVAVAVHGAWGMIRREPVYWLPRTVVHMARTMWTACRVILPLCWYEWRGAPKVAVGSGR